MRALLADVLEQVRDGVTPRELALRYAISQGAVKRYKSGRWGRLDGRPRKLTRAQERVCCACRARGEASVYELATIYGVTRQTIYNALRREGQRQLTFFQGVLDTRQAGAR